MSIRAVAVILLGTDQAQQANEAQPNPLKKGKFKFYHYWCNLACENKFSFN